MSNICFNLNNRIDISNNYYIFNNVNNIIGDYNVDDILIQSTYGLYQTSGNNTYSIQDIPKSHPIGFFDASNISPIVDISNLIKYDVSYGESIKIYVSKGSDLSFSNDNYYRFYDESYNLLNISGSLVETTLTNSGDNFYFMRSMKYTFIAMEDFSINHPFALSGEALNELNYYDLSLHKLDDSFNIIIPKDSNNTNNRIFYVDGLQNDSSGNLSILVDASNISYYYGDISLTVDGSFETHFDLSRISIKSFPLNGIQEISNTNIFVYDRTCDYIVEEISQFVNILYAQGKECLNIVSEAKLDTSTNNISYYEFNLNNHGRNDLTNEILYYLDYGIYDGLFTIFNVDKNFPFTIINNDVSNAIYVDEEYTTGILHKSDTRIQELGYPLNMYNFYYGTVSIKVDNNANTFIPNSKIRIQIFNMEENISYEPSNNFVYTEFCNDPDNVNNITFRDLSFVLFNQRDEVYVLKDFSAIENIYYLNLYNNYEEPIVPYRAIDRYNHDISYLVRSTAPVETTLPDGTILDNIFQINYDLSYFSITYTLEDYEKTTIELIRLVEIRRGPFIELLGNYDIFHNSNPFTNRIDILTNTIEPSLNFYNNLDVFVYDNSRNKINLPFEITLNGEFYLPISLNDELVLDNITGDSKKILKYENINVLDIPLQFENNYADLSLNYYLSKNFNFNFNTGSSLFIDELGIKILDISDIKFTNENSPILSVGNLIHINNENINNSYQNFLNDPLETKINSLYLDGASLYINKIDNSLNIIDISQNYKDEANNTDYELHTSIYITNSEFVISISDINESTNNFYIEGSFNSIDFFNSTYIDTQYIGKYEIIVDIKGLSNEDFIFNDLSNILDISSLILDFSRTFTVNVIHHGAVELNFVNQNIVNPLIYNYQYSRDFSFNIFTDISFFKEGDLYFENTNTPLLQLSDSSIYDGSLSFFLYPVSNITSIFNNNDFFIQATNQANSAEAHIVYNARDLCGNVSNDVSLNITFTDIPLLSLIGSRIEVINVHSTYNEPGLFIKGDIGNSVEKVSYVPSTGPYSVNYSSNYAITETTDNPNNGYDISWGLVLDINTIGIYELTYEVRKTGKTDSTYIKRFIEVVDILNPYFRFPDLRNIPYIDGSNDVAFVNVKDTLVDNKFDNSFNIDFSLTVFSSFYDLSFIINTFEVIDNYFEQTDLTTTITLSISGEGDISFTETGLTNVFSTNNGYLNSDNCFNKVTIGLNQLEPLRFNYSVRDLCDNSFNILRTVDIVDKSLPSIDFSFNYTNETDISYVLFSSDYKDFSYQAINYLKDAPLLLFELSSIIFDFSLIDNYEIFDSNYIISILGTKNNYIQDNIKTIDDISNEISSLELFSNVDTSLVIVYEISDNQYNNISINRKVDIINTIKPSINFISNNGFDDRIHIKFGDTKYDILSDFNLFHSRVFNTDINFDLSYILPPNITSLKGNIEYDPSAIIYSVSGDISSVHYDISFYSITLQDPYDISSEPINKKLIINNEGPSFNEIPYISINGNDSINIIHESGEFYNDASFILGVNAISEFDKFYYKNYSPDISYLYTNFQVEYDTSFNIYEPTIGFYRISYEALDKNNQSSVLERLILIVDSKPPIISLSMDVINVNQFEELNIPSAYFEDIGSDLSAIIIDLSNTSNNIIKNISKINLASNPVKTYQLTSSELLLNSNDTSNGTISYQIRYSAFDRFNKLAEKYLLITINETTNFVITPKLSIGVHELNLDLNFNSNFKFLINNNVDNLSSIFDPSDIVYDALNKTINYEVKKTEYFNLLNFDMTSRYINTIIPDYNNTVIVNIFNLTLGIHKVLFQSFNSSNFESLIEVIDFKIIDSTPPDLSFILSSDYENILDINIPLLSFNTYQTLKTNINYLENNSLSNPYYFTRDAIGNTMFSIPGINIYDILGGETQSLSNETIPTIYDNTLSLYITYVKNLSSGNYTINQGESINFAQINNTTETLTINPNLSYSTIKVSINDADVNSNGYAYVKFTYTDGTIHEFRHRGNGPRQFYNSTTGLWSAFYGLGDYSEEIRNYTDNTSKEYLIESTVIVGVNTWIFQALDGGVIEVELSENSSSQGMLGVKIEEIPIYDISTGYLLLNNGNYVQNYRVYDAAGNFSDISRAVSVERLEPFINLNYTQDDKYNIFLKTYHQVFSPFIDPLGRAYDYYLGEFTGNSLKTVKALPEDELGIHTVKYELENYPSTKAEREVQVVNITCLPIITNGLSGLITEGINHKYGLYNDNYIINISDPSNAIRLRSSVLDINYNYDVYIDISDLINISGEYIVNYDGYEYHWGRVDLSVNGNFNRANIEYLDSDLNRIILEDIFLYTEECFQILINELFDRSLPKDSFRVDVSGYNNKDFSYQYFTLSGELYPSYQDVNRHYITDLSRANLHLPMGKYTFIQDTEKNFYNRIKFSITEDGTHNGGKEYTKGIKEYSLPGLKGGYSELLISVNTPSPLYYYSENFPNMGGKIETRNNLVIAAANIYVNDNVLTVDNSLVLQSLYSEEILLNQVLLSQTFDCSGINGNDKFISNINFNCITQQNINHNILVNKDKNLIIFKKYQSSPHYDPLAEGVVTYVPGYDNLNLHTNISNENILHDISNHYLFDFSVNQYQSNIFQYNYTIDTSSNILSNLSINILKEEIVVAVGSGINTLAFSINAGESWTGAGKNLLDISGLGIGYNGTTRFIALGSGTNHSIIYSDNGIAWYETIDSKLIFDEYGKAAAYDNSNSYWFAGGKGSANTLAYSSDGINWIGLGKTVFENQINNFSKHNDIYILAFGNGLTNSIAYSSDGLNWNPGIDSGGGNTKVTFSVQANAGVYYNKKNVWLAVGEGDNNSIAYSYDGINWSGLGKSRIEEARDIDANDKMLVIVGKGNLNNSVYSAIIYSYDGLEWISTHTNIFSECNSIIWTGTRWIATGIGPNTTIAYSNNGIEWIEVNNNEIIFSYGGKSIEGFTKNTKIKDASNILYETNILDLFYTNEIDNYSNFFRKNRLLSSRLVKNNFISKINELRYVNHISLIDDNKIFNYFLDKYLSSNRIILSDILDNFITFNLQTYIDLSNLNINKDLLTILYNEQFPLYNTNANYNIDNSNLLFEEFVVNIWSDICGQFPIIVKSEEESILLSDGLIELNEYLLDSKDSSDVLYKLYNNELNTNGLDYVNEELKNTIFLSVRDISMINHDYNKYIGLTMENIYHNMYIDDDNILIFHSYQNLANNFKVNEPKLTLEKTISDFSNNKKYLLELSSNDVYGCFVDNDIDDQLNQNDNKNIYENSNRKNNILKQDSRNYKSFVTYFFDNELENDNNYLTNFDIRPISKNDICYNLYPYSYDSSLQKLHSHSYLVDLNDYFDRYIYDNSNLEVPWNMYNKSNLFYTIIDISFINDFNVFDVKANQNIIVNKNKIEILNYLQNFLVILNFKVDYLYKILNNDILFSDLPYAYNRDDYLFINTINVQNLNTFYNSIDFISTNYQITLPNNTLNKLFANNFYNTKQLKAKYLRLEQIFTYHQNNNYINLSEDRYDSIKNFNNVEQLSTDISLININVDNMLNNNLYYFYNKNVIETLNNKTSYSIINEYNDFNLLYNLLINFDKIKKDYDNIIYEFKVRHLNEGLFSTANIIDYNFVDLYDISSMDYFTISLLNNYVSLDKVLRNHIQFSNIHIDTGGGTFNTPDIRFTYTYNETNISLPDLSNQINFVLNNYHYFKDSIVRNYDFITKDRVYDNINYYMSGSKLLINSFYSNNLEIRFDIKYNSYLYPDKYVDTVVLDLAIPDYIPPTLIFNNTDLSFSQALSTTLDGNLTTLLELLIEDISFIELNQQAYDISYDLTNMVYHDTQYQAYVKNNLENNIYSTIEIDIRNLYNETTNFLGDDASINIFYTVIDNANNKNIITRTVNVERAFEYPEFFINGFTIEEFLLALEGTNWSLRVQQGTIITQQMLLFGITATDPASGSIPTLTAVNTLLDTNTPGIYEEAIIYTAISNKGVGITTTIRRDIIVTEAPPEEIEIVEADTNTKFYGPCPCPVLYKPIQHNYKLGSFASNAMRLSQIILRR